MFEILASLPNSPQPSNRRIVMYPVPPDNILRAEERLGFEFPEQLRLFFRECGCGFVKTSLDGSRTSGSNANRFLSPGSIADLLLGIDVEAIPGEGFGDGEIPFFEIEHRLFLVILPVIDFPCQIRWSRGNVISTSLVEFVSSLLQNPRFYHIRN